MGSQPTFGIRLALLITIASITTSLLAGCSTVNEGGGGTAAAPTTSIQTLEYYPYQVKGYQNSYPKKTIEILMPADARDTTGAAPLNGNPAIGVVVDQSSNVTERLYSLAARSDPAASDRTLGGRGRDERVVVARGRPTSRASRTPNMCSRARFADAG